MPKPSRYLLASKGPLWVLVLSLSACLGTSTQLKKGAQHVQIRKESPSSSKSTRLGEVSCDYGHNARMVSTNLQACRNDMRNQGLSLGADVVVIETEQAGTAACSNCVSMFGTAYKLSKKQSKRNDRKARKRTSKRVVPTVGTTVGEFSMKKKTDPATQLDLVTFSYTPAPGLELRFASRLRDKTPVSDEVTITIVSESLKGEKFSDGMMLALVTDKGEQIFELQWNASQLKGGIAHEVLSTQFETTELRQQFREISSLEFRVGKLEFALPSKAIARLQDFVEYVKTPSKTSAATIEDPK